MSIISRPTESRHSPSIVLHQNTIAPTIATLDVSVTYSRGNRESNRNNKLTKTIWIVELRLSIQTVTAHFKGVSNRKASQAVMRWTSCNRTTCNWQWNYVKLMSATGSSMVFELLSSLSKLLSGDKLSAWIRDRSWKDCKSSHSARPLFVQFPQKYGTITRLAAIF